MESGRIANQLADDPLIADQNAAGQVTPVQGTSGHVMVDRVTIHVRFSPDGSVTEIVERPRAENAQAWFNRLSDKAGASYQPLSGGRALFRLTRAEIDDLKTATSR